jgi:hypothetical protein
MEFVVRVTWIDRIGKMNVRSDLIEESSASTRLEREAHEEQSLHHQNP